MTTRHLRIFLVDADKAKRVRLINRLLDEPDMDVANTAADGCEAMEKLTRINPDIILLDDNLSGLLQQMRSCFPKLPVVIMTDRDPGSRDEQVDGLVRHAMVIDGSDRSFDKSVIEQLLPGIRSFFASPQTRKEESKEPEKESKKEPIKVKRVIRSVTSPKVRKGLVERARHSRSLLQRLPRSSKDTVDDLVVVGVSTGGPKALLAFVSSLPANYHAPVVIAIHMPEIFTTSLARRLDQESRLVVREATQGEQLQAGHIYISPGNHHILLNRSQGHLYIELNQEERVNFCRPSVDVLFRSAAALTGFRIVGIIMTGMGNDGLEGARLIRQKGGQVIAQNRETCVVWGMPRMVTEAGLANFTLPLDLIGRKTVELTRRPHP